MNDAVQLGREESSSTASPKYPALEWLVPALLCAVLLGELFLTGNRLSQTADEATHLYAGYRYLKCGDLTVSPEHPPLARVVAAAPLLAMEFTVDCAPSKDDGLYQAMAAQKWLYTQDWPVALARARLASCVFAIGLCVLVWIAARNMFGFSTAVVASLLLIFEPNLLAYGSLVMTDVPVTCMLLGAVAGFYFWIKNRTALTFVLTALATGMTLLSKQSGVVLIPILCALAIADVFAHLGNQEPAWRPMARNLCAVLLIAVCAMGVVWFGYGLRFEPYRAAPGRPAQVIDEQPAASTSRTEIAIRRLEGLYILPQAYLEGFSTALTLSHEGSGISFVAGRIYQRAPWFSTPLNLSMRSTLAMLALICVAMFGAAAIVRSRPRECLFLLIPASIYLAVCCYANRNVSIRYLLPALPFLCITVAASCVEAARRFRYVGHIVIIALLTLHATSSLRTYPNYLAYANELWGGPEKAYEYQPWIDLGQGYLEAKAYLREHPAKKCWLITAWQWDPALYDLPCQTSGLYLPHQVPPLVRGVAIVSSTLLSDIRLSEQELAQAFRGATPKAYLGGSALLVYEGDFDTRLNAAIGERNLAAAAFNNGQIDAAVGHGKVAAELAPGSAIEHGDMCIFFAAARADLALPECYRARDLLLQDPLRDEAGRKKYLKSLEDALPRVQARYLQTTGGSTSSVAGR